MTVADLLEKRQRGIFTDDKILKCELIALDGMTGRSLFDTRRSKKETVAKYSSGEIIFLWADVRLCRGVGYGDYFKPVMKCYVAHDSWETDEERNRRLCRENYAAQMELLGYDADGNPNNQNGGCYKAHEMIEDRLHCKCGCEMVITGEWEKYDHCPKCGAKVEVYATPWDRNRKR